MNNLTTEQKARIFALYLGQQAYCPSIETDLAMWDDTRLVSVRTFGLTICNEEDGMIECPFDDCRLLLRPLSAITDEDAVEVAKCYWVHFQATSTAGRAIIEDIISDEFSDEYSLNQAWEMYSLLIRMGYAVPLYLSQDDSIYGKTAIELGIAIDPTTTTSDATPNP